MINLIPPEGQKLVKREYVLRVMSVLFFLYGGVFIVLSVALIPTYVLIGVQIKTLLLEAVEKGEEAAAFAAADVEVRMAKGVLAQLKLNPASQITRSSVIEEVRKVAPSGVSFRNFLVEDKDGAIAKIQIQGNAATREDLARFRETLQASPLFETAEVPIADLARDVDLPFTVTVTLKSEKK